MGRLNEVRKEIEQLCEEIEQEALRSPRHTATGDGVVPAPPVHIHLVVSGDISHMRLKISLQKDDDQTCR